MSLRDDPVLAKTYAGLLAASNAVVSKFSEGRPPPSAPYAPGFRPASLAEVPRLMAGAKPIHQAIAASLCHAYESSKDGEVTPGGYTEKICRNGNLNGELKKYQATRKAVAPKNKSSLSLLRTGLDHSRDLFAQLHPSPVTVVTPDVQIVTDFGEGGSNISKASITNYQLLLSEESATQVLGRSNPLNWKQGAPDLFKSVVPAKQVGERPKQTWMPDPHRDPKNWQKAASQGVEYIYESAVWPWSDSITLGVENVLAISGFQSSEADGDKKVLSYTYALERCIRSDYGFIVEELSGLDIDGGQVDGRAVPVASALKDASTPNVDDLRRLTKEHKRQHPGYEPWLLTISSSKSLRYTVPQYAPVDLWASLTWLAPALLYTFINRAVCQLPQFVEEEVKTGKTLQLLKGTAP